MQITSISLSRWLQDFQHFQSFCECVGVLRLNEAPKKFGIIVLPKNLDLYKLGYEIPEHFLVICSWKLKEGALRNEQQENFNKF